MKTGRGDERWCCHDNRQAERAAWLWYLQACGRRHPDGLGFNLLSGRKASCSLRWDHGRDGRGGCVGEGEVCVCVCVCVNVCACGGWGGDYKVRHQLNLCLRAQTWEMKKVVGVIFFFFFFFFFVTIPIQQWPTTETWEGQTNRLTHRRTHNTYTHTHTVHRNIFSATIMNLQEINHTLYLAQTNEHTDGRCENTLHAD